MSQAILKKTCRQTHFSDHATPLPSAPCLPPRPGHQYRSEHLEGLLRERRTAAERLPARPGVRALELEGPVAVQRVEVAAQEVVILRVTYAGFSHLHHPAERIFTFQCWNRTNFSSLPHLVFSKICRCQIMSECTRCHRDVTKFCHNSADC